MKLREDKPLLLVLSISFLIFFLYYFEDIVYENLFETKKTSLSQIEFNKKLKIYREIERNAKYYGKNDDIKKLKWLILDKLRKKEQKIKKIKKKVKREYYFNLQAILKTDKKIAIINSKFVHEGSKIGVAKVLKIKDNSVLIKIANKNIWLRLK